MTYRTPRRIAALSIVSLASLALAPAFVIGCSNLTSPPEPIASDTATAEKAADVPRPAASSAPRPQASAPPPRPQPTPQPAPPVPEDVKAPPATAKKTASGLAYRVLKPGKGESPKATDRVTVHYSGWTLDGKMFDSSVTRGEPTTFPLNGVIKGWTEGVQLMKVGEKTRFWIPADLAYGEKPQRPGAPAGMLVFDIELIGINQPPPGMPPGHP
jgi:FKBP-type peptidyl-prolyl cis-trans isomerase